MSGPATIAVYKGSEICEQFKSSETFGRIKEEVERKHKDWTRFEVWPYPSEDEFFPIPIWIVEKKDGELRILERRW